MVVLLLLVLLRGLLLPSLCRQQPDKPDNYLGPLVTGPDQQELQGCVSVSLQGPSCISVHCWFGPISLILLLEGCQALSPGHLLSR